MCEHYKTFWVSWQSGRMAVGKGLIRNKNTLMEFGDMAFNEVNAVGFASENEATATWVFSEDVGMYKLAGRVL